jgi:hypothetical protein
MNMNDLFNAVMQLDLSPIKVKLMHIESGEGWSLQKADAVEKEYRRFLCLMKLYPDESTAPLVDVDTFWHYHILDTMKYAADCEQAFGYFLHHYPYLGLHGEDDEQLRLDSADRMRTLYEATFGDAYPGALAQAADAPAYCAGPVVGPAYCAGPVIRNIKAGAPAANTAYCAGPVIRMDSAARPAANSAYCAGPVIKAAYCAGPVIKPAYCAGPVIRNVKRTEPAANTAYCGGPVINPAHANGLLVQNSNNTAALAA